MLRIPRYGWVKAIFERGGKPYTAGNRYPTQELPFFLVSRVVPRDSLAPDRSLLLEVEGFIFTIDGGIYMISGNELREKFLKFFAEKKGHLILPSASLIPDDPTVLLNIAGMVPFKPYFLGKAVPPRVRVTTSQKCVRTNDLDNVGRTARHHTFFEMLGNFSFGDYFKEEVIPWAWEFLTQELKIEQDRLWVSVYEDDDDAFRIWHEKVGLPPERIKRMGKDDNFWEMGATGPCGPCSEIYYDFGPEKGCGKLDCGVGCDCDRYLEIWNLVFMEFNRSDDGILTPLPQQNIDTGMGLERIASVMQGVDTNFDTDLLKPIIDFTAQLACKTYKSNEKDDLALKVIADHIRATVFLISDGVLPSNEGRGYVLRRIMRRAMRYGKLLGLVDPFLYRVAQVSIDLVKGHYQDVGEKADFIKKVIRTEEERFQETLDQGINLLNKIVNEAKEKGSQEVSGQDIFRLYDTYGFPLELTEELASEQGMTVDRQGFQSYMEEQRERARSARSESGENNIRHSLLAVLDKNVPDTEFIGYGSFRGDAQIEALVQGKNLVSTVTAEEEAVFVFDKTVFYAESGGQIGDSGIIYNDNGKAVITDTQRLPNGKTVHFGRVLEGELKTGESIKMTVEEEKRIGIMGNHTATHLLHRALREVLGEHVKQAGSLVSDERLRFDFSHFSTIDKSELNKIEDLVNAKIRANLPIEVIETTLERAKELGAIALFGEKYGKYVRVVKIGDFSIELCGGTHLHSTGSLGVFKILSESGIGSGLRRIEAVSGAAAYEYLKKHEEILTKSAALLKATPDELESRIEALQVSLREKEREIEKLQNKLAKNQINDIVNEAKEVGGFKIIAKQVEAADMEGLRAIGDLLKERFDGVIVLGAASNEKVNLLVLLDKNSVDKGLHAGKIIREIAKIVQGGGGGRPDMAQAGGKDPAKLPDAIAKAMDIVASQIKG